MKLMWIADLALAVVLAVFLALLVRLGRTSEPYDDWVARQRKKRGGR